MDPRLQQETEAAAREILEYLEASSETPVQTLRDAVGKPDLYFYMGLGDLILKRLVTIQHRQEAFWAIRRPGLVKAA